MYRCKFTLLTLFFIAFFIPSMAQTLEEAELLTGRGAFAEADSIYRILLEKAPNNAFFKEARAKMLLQVGRDNEVVHLLLAGKGKKRNETLILLAQAYHRTYRFSEAISTIELMRGKKKELPNDMHLLKAKASRAAQMLEYAESVEVIDSIQVDLSQLSHFPQGKLSREWGAFLKQESTEARYPIYQTSLGYERYYSSIGDNGSEDIYYTRKVANTWDQATPLAVLNSSFDEIYPVLRQDGITLLFSHNGTEGIGGYDLYMTRQKSDTKEFLPPTLLGMPFNSPFNDYFLIYDDLYKVGVLASDRFCPMGKVNIYTFRLNDTTTRITTNDLESKRPIAAWYPWRDTQNRN